MFSESADIYDLVYSFKDYKKESGQVIREIRSRLPGCKSILDIACGTGEHHKYLSKEFSIDGIDLDENLLQRAKEKNPGCHYFAADMTGFQLDKKYDLITCLFSSIGYVKTKEKLLATLTCFQSHLNENGLLMIEPWFTPETWYPGKVHMLTYEKEDVKICRMNRSEVNGKISIINFHYLLGTSKEGVNYFTEHHELGLFTVNEMKTALTEAGFKVEYDPQGLTGRGMYYGTKFSG